MSPLSRPVRPGLEGIKQPHLLTDLGHPWLRLPSPFAERRDGAFLCSRTRLSTIFICLSSSLRSPGGSRSSAHGRRPCLPSISHGIHPRATASIRAGPSHSVTLTNPCMKASSRGTQSRAKPTGRLRPTGPLSAAKPSPLAATRGPQLTRERRSVSDLSPMSRPSTSKFLAPARSRREAGFFRARRQRPSRFLSAGPSTPSHRPTLCAGSTNQADQSALAPLLASTSVRVRLWAGLLAPRGSRTYVEFP